MTVMGRHMTLSEQYLIYILLSMYGYFAPVQPVLISLSVIIFIDLIMAIWAKIKIGKQGGWGKLLLTAARNMGVMVLIIVATFEYQKLSGNVISLISIAATAFALREIISIIQNAEIILGKSIFSVLLKKLGSINKDESDKKGN